MCGPPTLLRLLPHLILMHYPLRNTPLPSMLTRSEEAKLRLNVLIIGGGKHSQVFYHDPITSR